MIFGLFRDRELESFARELARELSLRVPPATVTAERATNPGFQATLAKAFQHVFLSVRNYCREHKVGLLKKARLSKIFQDELVSLGYQGDFVKEVTLALAEQLTQH